MNPIKDHTLTVYNLDNHPTRPFTEFVDLQGDLKDYVYLDRLTARIRQVGFKYDFLVWEASEVVEHQGQTYPARTPFIVDAHARQRALQRLADEGLTIPPVPYTRVHAESLQEAKEELLFLNSRYGEIQPMSEFLTDVLATVGEVSLLALPELSALPEFSDRPEPVVLDIIDDDETEPSPGTPASGQKVFPLAVVLSREQYADWEAYKDEIGKKTDTTAFLTLFHSLSEE